MIGMLIIQSYWDIRYKEIPILVTIFGGFLGIICSVLRERAPGDLMEAVIPGLFCLLIGKITRQALGYGDGFLLCAMGMYVSCGTLLSILMTACIAAGIVALALLVFGKKHGKDQIPFVPFLLLASVLAILYGNGGIV